MSHGSTGHPSQRSEQNRAWWVRHDVTNWHGTKWQTAWLSVTTHYNGTIRMTGRNQTCHDSTGIISGYHISFAYRCYLLVMPGSRKIAKVFLWHIITKPVKSLMKNNSIHLFCRTKSLRLKYINVSKEVQILMVNNKKWIKSYYWYKGFQENITFKVDLMLFLNMQNLHEKVGCFWKIINDWMV